jgi:hypothetical protein
LEGIVVTWRELLFGALLVLGIYIAEVLLLTRFGKGRGAGHRDETQEREIQALELDITRLHERLNQLQGDVEQLKSERENAARPYNDAVKMAEGGVDADKLAASCGISRGEAELIIAVNRLSQGRNAP